MFLTRKMKLFRKTQKLFFLQQKSLRRKAPVNQPCIVYKAEGPLLLEQIHFKAEDQKVTINGGEGGIRTPGTHKRTIDFESTALDHSATSPIRGEYSITVSCHVQNILQRPKMLIRSSNP